MRTAMSYGHVGKHEGSLQQGHGHARDIGFSHKNKRADVKICKQLHLSLTSKARQGPEHLQTSWRSSPKAVREHSRPLQVAQDSVANV